MKAEKVKRASYTLEYKLEAVRLVQGGQSCAAIAKVLGMPCQSRVVAVFCYPQSYPKMFWPT
jgi:transposase-like protein